MTDNLIEQELAQMNVKNAKLVQKWKPIIEHKNYAPIADTTKKAALAVMLENLEADGAAGLYESVAANISAGANGFTSAATAAGPVAGFDPMLISLVRRSAPNLVAFDLMGVQPMNAPSGMVFSLRSTYGTQGGDEAFYNEVNAAYSAPGTAAMTGATGDANADTTLATFRPTGVPTNVLERLGSDGGTAIPEMAFSIEKFSVTAVGRALQTSLTTELITDLKKVHGLDAISEVQTILAAEIISNINREAIRTIYAVAKVGSLNTAVPGVFNMDIDADGRHAEEKWKGLLFQIGREANAVAKETRRGKANILLCSSDVATALQMTGKLSYAPALAGATDLNVDDTGATFAGILNNQFRVYIDPYAVGDYFIVGYKGASAWDSGVYYCPYVALQLHTAVGENNYQPRMAFKTRYAMAANPFAHGAAKGNGQLVAGANVYYRRTLVTNLL